MKELVMKKRTELEELCRITHIEPDTSTSAEKSNAMIDSGMILFLSVRFLLGYPGGKRFFTCHKAINEM